MRIVTKSNPENDFFSFMSKRRKYIVFRCFANFSSEQEYFTHGMNITALIRTSDVKKPEPIMFYEGLNAKVFRRNIAFGIDVLETSRSSSFKYTMSVHAVHAGAERNVCSFVVSTEVPQTTTNPSQTLLPGYKLAHLPLPQSKSSPPRPHNFSSAFLRRCATDVSKRTRPPAQIYLKCISFIYVYICDST